MLMLCQILLRAKHAKATLSGGCALSPTAELSPTTTFALQNLASFSPENAHISSLNPMEMFWRHL